MLQCKVCSTENHHLATICHSCGGFLQQKVENLNLFEIVWKVIEYPRIAMKTVAMSRHKNYVVLLNSITGIGITFAIFWHYKIAEFIQHLHVILFLGIIVGPFVGHFFSLIFSLSILLALKLNSIVASLRNVYAVVTYSLLPIALSAIFILPLEVLSFGIFLFTKNPSPYLINPFSYLILFGIDILCIVWTLVLLVFAIKIIGDINTFRATKILLLSGIILAMIIASILILIPKGKYGVVT